MATPILVITGPSGVGKGTLIRGLLERVPGLELAVSATTRKPREGEVNGVDYHFLSEEDFDRRVAAGEFVEHAEYAGNRYGTLKSELRRPARGIVLEIDVQGARQVREALPEAMLVFIEPPSFEDLERRLAGPRRPIRPSRSSAGSPPRATSWPRPASSTTASSTTTCSAPCRSSASLPLPCLAP